MTRHAALRVPRRTASGSPPPRFRADLQGLRALAVLTVVLYHARVPGLNGGYVGVDVFFVLSGFVITGLLVRELDLTGRISLPAFYARRARRLLPAAVLVLLATAGACVLLLPPLAAREALADTLWAALYAANLRFAVQQSDYLAAGGEPSPVLHFWSLAVEEQFYLVWPLLLLAAHRSRRRGAAPVLALAVASLSLLAGVHLTTTSQPWAFFSLPTRAWEFGAGALVALADPALRRLPVAVAVPLGWAGLLVVVGSVLVLDDTAAFPGVVALAPVLGTAAVVAAGARAVPRGPVVLLRSRAAQALGALSYSWYLWHWPVLVLAPVALDRALTLPERLVAALASAALAAGTLRLLEQPVRTSRVLARRPARGLALGLGLTALALATTVGAAQALPAQGGGRAATPALAAPPVPSALPPQAPAAPARRPPPDPLAAALALAARQTQLPANLTPSLRQARRDRARVFRDGCHAEFVQVRVRSCTYGDPASSRRVVLLGDSNAAMWFPALEPVAERQNLRLVSLSKSTCPPLPLRVHSLYLRRSYTECDVWRDRALARVDAERPELVVVGIARHYVPEYGFEVYGPQWTGALTDLVQRLRRTGARVVVLGPAPLPRDLEPRCLSEHPSDLRACDAQPPSARRAAERAAVAAAGGDYLDVRDLFCAGAVCPGVVGNVLVYRDDNHLTQRYAELLSPVLAARLRLTGPAG